MKSLSNKQSDKYRTQTSDSFVRVEMGEARVLDRLFVSCLTWVGEIENE